MELVSYLIVTVSCVVLTMNSVEINAKLALIKEIESEMVGHQVSGLGFNSIITLKQLLVKKEKLENELDKMDKKFSKCDFCDVPCRLDWCHTKGE